MGFVHIQPAARADGPWEVRNFSIESGATFKQGAPVARDGTNTENVEEHAGGATVTGLLGFAMVGVSSGVPEAKGDVAYGATIPVALANDDTEFMGPLLNADAIVTPVKATHEGVSYGLIKHSTLLYWGVDEADTTNVHVRITRVFPELKLVAFKVLPSVIGV